jgi:nucleotide-binding universal stress UspA family protein
MKVRSSPKTGRTVVELGRRDAALPAVPLDEIQLKRILVPVDFSECSNKALHYAASFAKQFGAEVLLLHVVQPPVYMEGMALSTAAFDETTLRREAAKRLSEWQNAVASGATLKTSVRTGAPYHEIVETAEETNTDLIILGTHGRGRLARMLIGSTAERVVRHAPCPVMVVREREHDFLRDERLSAGETTQLKAGRYGKRSKEKQS